MSTREKFLAEIEDYRTRMGWSAREFGVNFRGDTAFLYRLRKGRGVTLEQVDKCRAWMAANPPKSKKKRRTDEVRTSA
jgi:hypothetical protein